MALGAFVSSLVGTVLARHPAPLFIAAGVCFGVYLEQSYVLPRLNDELERLQMKEEEMRKTSTTATTNTTTTTKNYKKKN